MKTCTKCHKTKEYTSFYHDRTRADGYFPHCKECSNKRVKRWCRANRERTRKIQRKCASQADRKEFRRVYIQQWRAKFRQKSIAHQRVNDAVRAGRLTAQSCAVCGESKTVAHHEDYSRPLDVVWLCALHHNELHRKEELWHTQGLGVQ